MDLIVAGTEKGVLMVESEAHQLSEDEMLKAVVLGQNSYKIVIDTIAELAKKSSKEPIEIPEIDVNEDNFGLTGKQVSLFPIIPSITWHFKF